MRPFIASLIVGISFFLSPLTQAQDPKKKFIPFPVFYYTPETSVAFGGLAIINIDKVADGKTSNIVTSLSYTAKKQTIFIFTPKFYLSGGQTEIFGSLRYMFFPSDYYGRGNDTKKSDKQSFALNSLASDIGIRSFVWSHLFVSAYTSQYNQKVVGYTPGRSLDDEISAGFGEYRQLGAGTSVGWDHRDYQNAPLKGAFHTLSATHYWTRDPHNLIQDHTFEKYDLDLRHYWSVGEKRVLGAQWFLGKTEGRSVPFQSLYRLGGSNQLRGYIGGRFRDKAIALFQFDYRQDLSESWAFSVFAGTGVLAPDFSTLSKNRRRSAAGVGAHYIVDPENRNKFRFDLGIGEEGDMGFYVVFGEAF